MHDDGVRTLPEGYVLGFGIRRYHMPGDGESFAGAVQLRAAVFDGGEVADGGEEYEERIHQGNCTNHFAVAVLAVGGSTRTGTWRIGSRAVLYIMVGESRALSKGEST